MTILSVHLGYLLGGAIIIEFVFDYPGLGLLTIVGVLQRDFTVVQGIVNGPHTLEIIPVGDGAVPLREIVVHRPPLR